jgi:hypothetical protein
MIKINIPILLGYSRSLQVKPMSNDDSNDIVDTEDQPTPVKAKPPIAVVLLLVLILIAGVFGLYIGSFWMAQSSQLAKLKARNGDFVQLRFELEEGKEEPYFSKMYREMLPAPIQNVYWRNNELTADDVALLLTFKDAEVVVIGAAKVEGEHIGKLMGLPKLKRMRIKSTDIGVEGIEKWSVPKDFVMLSLANPQWKSSDFKEIENKAKENKGLDDKLEVTSQTGPAAGGG